MKGLTRFSLFVECLLLFVLFPKILLAGQKSAVEMFEVDGPINQLNNGQDHQHGLNHPRNAPYSYSRDRFHQKMEKRGREYHSLKETNANTKTAADTWEIEAVDAPKYFRELSQRAIVVDKNNHPHVAYGADHLYYAYYDGSTWSYETVDASSGAGPNAAIALDSTGKVHISYYDTTNFDLKYATNAGQITPTPTATPTPACVADTITPSETKITLPPGESEDITVTMTGAGNCPAEGETVTAKVNKAGEKVITVSPSSNTADSSGRAIFTITALNKTGTAKINFKSGKLKAKLKVKIAG